MNQASTAEFSSVLPSETATLRMISGDFSIPQNRKQRRAESSLKRRRHK